MSDSVQMFRDLHQNSSPLKLANVWDAASAKIAEVAGATAVATTSAGVAWSLGYADGRMMPIQEAVDAAERMVRVLNVPLSVDFEHGYSHDPTQVGENIKRLLDIGIAGINIEDGFCAPEVLVAKIESIRTVAAQMGQDIFINARCDVFLAKLASESLMVRESIIRGRMYAIAGADGLFLPAIHKPEDIKAVIAEVDLPLNVMSWSSMPPIQELGLLGVRRLSVGFGIAHTIWGKTDEMIRAFLSDAGLVLGSEKNMAYGKLQSFFG